MDLHMNIGAHETPTHDVVIIGGGPAGASAALYAARAGLDTVVLDKSLSAGALAVTGKIANYPGVTDEPTGAELLRRMHEHAASFGAQFIESQVVSIGAPAARMMSASWSTLASIPAARHCSTSACSGRLLAVKTPRWGARPPGHREAVHLNPSRAYRLPHCRR